MVQFLRKDPMATGVSREEIDIPACDFPPNDHVRRGTKWSLEREFLRILESLELIKAAPTNDADCRLVCSHARGDYSEEEKIGKREFWLARLQPMKAHTLGLDKVAAFRF